MIISNFPEIFILENMFQNFESLQHNHFIPAVKALVQNTEKVIIYKIGGKNISSFFPCFSFYLINYHFSYVEYGVCYD